MCTGSGKEDSAPKKGEATQQDEITNPSKSGTQRSVQELELQLEQALKERDALLDHVLELRNWNLVCNIISSGFD